MSRKLAKNVVNVRTRKFLAQRPPGSDVNFRALLLDTKYLVLKYVLLFPQQKMAGWLAETGATAKTMV